MMKHKLALLVIIVSTLWLIPVMYHARLSCANPTLGLLIMLVSLVLLVVGSVYGCRWLARKFVKSYRSTTIQLFAFATILVLLLSMLMLVLKSEATLDIQVHATYFVIGQYHVLILLSIILGIYAIAYYLVQKISGKKINEVLGELHFWLTTVGSMLLLFPYNLLGQVPRRYYSYDVHAPFEWANDFIRIMVILIAVAQLVFICNLIVTVLKKLE